MPTTAIPGSRDCEAPDDEMARRLMWLRPYVRQSGHDQRTPWHLPRRRLFDYLVVLILHGEGQFAVGEHSFPVGAGHFIWVPPDTPHEMCGHSDITELLYVHFDLIYDPHRSHWDAFIPGGFEDVKAYANRLHPPLPDTVIRSWSGRLPMVEKSFVEHRLRRICLEHRRAPAGNALLLSGLLIELVGHLLGEFEMRTRAPHAHVEAIRRVAAHIAEHPEHPLDGPSLANACRLSPSHFRRLFEQTMGVNPRSYHQRERLRRACELLTYSGLNVSEIADQLGYSTVHNLSRAFKRLTGRCPTDYRKWQM